MDLLAHGVNPVVLALVEASGLPELVEDGLDRLEVEVEERCGRQEDRHALVVSRGDEIAGEVADGLPVRMASAFLYLTMPRLGSRVVK